MKLDFKVSKSVAKRLLEQVYNNKEGKPRKDLTNEEKEEANQLRRIANGR